MPSKKEKTVFLPDDPGKTMSKEEATKELERFFKRLEEDTPKELREIGADRVKEFIEGEVSWSDMFNLPKQMVRDMVEYGYLQFQTGRYEEAERFFKMLTIMDWNNSYYHSMMGSILQRQKRFGEAIAEYAEAVKLNPTDVVSLTNRGEIYLQHKIFGDAAADFDKAIALDPKKENKWANRARVLKAKIEQVEKVLAAQKAKAAKTDEKDKKAEKGKKKKK